MINVYFIVAVFLLLVLSLIVFYPKKKLKKNSHRRRIKRGEKILLILNSFEHDGAKINYLKKIDPFVFEELILSAFEKKGYRIKRNKRYTGDGGIDGIVYDQNKRSFLIQCKRYKDHIKKQDLIEFKELIKSKNFDGGYFCHTGRTSKTSLFNYRESNLHILSGDKLIKLITSNN